jgi:hypothetical protein
VIWFDFYLSVVPFFQSDQTRSNLWSGSIWFGRVLAGAECLQLAFAVQVKVILRAFLDSVCWFWVSSHYSCIIFVMVTHVSRELYPMGVLLIRGVDPSRARNSWETQQSLYVVAKVRYKSSIGLSSSSTFPNSFAHLDFHGYWIVRVPLPFALALRAS